MRGYNDFLYDWLCTLCCVISKLPGLLLIEIDPRHRTHHLSLLPSGPDEVRECLLRSVRSNKTWEFQKYPKEGVQPRISGFRDEGTASSPPSTTAENINTTNRFIKE